MLMFVAAFLTFMAIGGFPSFVEDMKVRMWLIQLSSLILSIKLVAFDRLNSLDAIL